MNFPPKAPFIHLSYESKRLLREALISILMGRPLPIIPERHLNLFVHGYAACLAGRPDKGMALLSESLPLQRGIWWDELLLWLMNATHGRSHYVPCLLSLSTVFEKYATSLETSKPA